MKPRISIQVRPGRDFAGRSLNLWCGVNLYPEAYNDRREYITLGAVWLSDLREVIRSYFRKLERLRRRVERRRVIGHA